MIPKTKVRKTQKWIEEDHTILARAGGWAVCVGGLGMGLGVYIWIICMLIDLSFPYPWQPLHTRTNLFVKVLSGHSTFMSELKHVFIYYLGEYSKP